MSIFSSLFTKSPSPPPLQTTPAALPNQSLADSQTSQTSLSFTELKNTINSLSDGVAIISSDCRIVFINPIFEQITNYKQDEVSGKPIDQLLQIQNQVGQSSPFLNFYSAVFSSIDNSIYPPQSVTIIGKGGAKSQVNINLHKTNATNKDLGFFMIIHNLTEERIFQQMQIDFVSMASHEFRTPLTSIINYLAVLNEEIKEKLDTSQQQLLERATTSAQQLSVLVDNILNVAKIERGSLAVSLEIIDWGKTVSDVFEDNRQQALHKNISFKLNLIPDSLPKVTADPVRIKEVLNNLINNALTYTKEGGQVEIGSRLSDHQILTYVKDSGIGIPKEAVPHLFTKFYRAPGALSQMSKGNGLGLYLSKSIVDLHHGKIWVESTVGVGSTFFFTLPSEQSQHSTPTIVELDKNTY